MIISDNEARIIKIMGNTFEIYRSFDANKYTEISIVYSTDPSLCFSAVMDAISVYFSYFVQYERS